MKIHVPSMLAIGIEMIKPNKHAAYKIHKTQPQRA